MSEEQYAGHIATTIGLSLVGATAAKAVVQGIKGSTVLSKISGALGDPADATKVAQYVNRLKGIGFVNSRILIDAVFTTAFAGLACGCGPPKPDPRGASVAGLWILWELGLQTLPNLTPCPCRGEDFRRADRLAESADER